MLTFVGLPGLKPLPWWQTLAIFVCAMIACLGLNDALKVAMIKWRVLNAVTKKPGDVTQKIAERAYELYEQRGRQATDGPQRAFYEVLARYYSTLATDLRQIMEKRKAV